MLRSALTYGYVAVSLVAISPYMLWLKLRRKETYAAEYAARVSGFARVWARGIIKASGAKLHITGLEQVPKDRAVVFIANHQSDFDIVMFLAYAPVPVGFVAKIELMKIPFLRTWIDLLGSVFIDRKDIRQTAKAIIKGIEKIKSGQSIVLFPEGTRSRSDEMIPFKPGSFKLATKPQAVIVPVTIDGTYKLMEGNNYKIKPADVTLLFHLPVYTENISQEALAAIPKQVENTIKAGLK